MARRPEFHDDLAPLSSTMASAPPTPTAETSLRKVISTRQFVFMAIGSSIGAGVLLATYSGLAVGGPASLFLSFAIVGVSVWITMCALGELSAAFPVTGSFYEYAIRFISPGWGFSLGWSYAIGYLLVVAFELLIMVKCVHYWAPDLRTFCLLPIFIIALMLVNTFGARWYAELENMFAVCKMVVLTAFIITAAVILGGIVPSDPRSTEEIGIHTWQRAAFKNGGIGFLYVFMAAGMAYGGVEMLGLMVAECKQPDKVMPLACKLVPVRVTWLYLLPILMAGFVLEIPMGAEVTSGGLSPFVAAMEQARLPVIATIFNGVIVMSIFSMACASVFASSRTFQAISARGMGPAFLAKIKWGQPIWALAVVYIFSLLAFVKNSSNGDEIFDWFMAATAGSNYLTWISICVCQIRLRLAIRKKGLREGDILKWRSPFGITGSVIAIVIFLFGLISQIVATARSPLPRPPHILSSILGMLIAFVFWAGYSLVKRHDTYLIPLDQIKLEPTELEWTAPLAGNGDVESIRSETVQTSINER